MSDLSKLSKLMKEDWDRRVKHDYRFWMSDGYESDEAMWASGARDFDALTGGIADTGNKTYLDLGCGVGRLMKTALSRFGRVIGIDISEAAIGKAKEFLGNYPNLQLILGTGIDLQPVPSNSVDVVGSFAALCSIPTDVVANYLREIHRVLKPGGESRIQVYIGKEQPVTKEDTLHLRCFEETNFRHALAAAGFDIVSIRDLILPLETSIKELGIEAKVATLKKSTRDPASTAVVSRALLPHGEGEGENVAGQEIEYWMSLNHAKNLAEHGDVDRAKRALQYAEAFSKATTIDVRDILNQIVTHIAKTEDSKHAAPSPIAETNGHAHTPGATASSGEILERNMRVLKDKFPTVFEKIQKGGEECPSLEVRDTNDGPTIYLEGQCLDHVEKPIAAGDAWAKRSLGEKRFVDCKHIAVLGVGAGYHVESLLQLTDLKVSLIEPSIAVFRKALELRDLSAVLLKISALSVGEEEKLSLFDLNSELLVRPQSVAVYGKYLPRVKEQFYGARGLSSLQPTIMVLGPLQGGTLPIAGYTIRGLQSLGQRTREMDVSGFASGYHVLEGMVKDKVRQTHLHQNYLEMISQGVLEAIDERRIDILICMAQAPISGRVLLELRKRGIITVLWFMEDYLRFTYWREMAKFYDFVFTIQKGECLELIRAAGAGEVHYIPAGCDPVVHTPLSLTDEERAEWGSPISFVGAGYHNRQQVFASFAEMPFKLWGTEWPGCKPFDRMLQAAGRRLTPEEYIKIFNATDININLHSSTERDGVDPFGDFVNPRTFELASVGAFQLVDERLLLPEVFEPGKEIVTFNSPRDLKEKISYYIDKKEERIAIGQRARTRALSEHTYGHRIRDMLSIIYSSKFEHLKGRQDASPWNKMLERSSRHVELHDRCKAAFDRGEEPILDGLVVDILAGKGKLTETEQKLLFLYHVRKQIIRMKTEEAGG